MSNKVYVFSTLATPMDYHVYAKAAENMPPVRERTVHIAGGAGIANKHLITPNGVMTEISEEELSLLENHGIFQMHKKNGYIKVERRAADVDKVAADMNPSDPSKPLTPSDFKEDDGDPETLTSETNSTQGKKSRK